MLFTAYTIVVAQLNKVREREVSRGRVVTIKNNEKKRDQNTQINRENGNE